MRPGDYFGEISLIFGCKRTATVESSKYSTLAKLSKQDYKEALIEFPIMQTLLKNGIYQYHDRMKRFIKNSLNKIHYF